MSSSYDRNIERMRSRERFNVQQANAQRTNMANTMGNRGIREAGQLSDQLSAFSSTLKEMRKKDIEKKQEAGRIAAQETAEINAQKLVELESELSTLTETDTRYHEIKGEMLKMSGPDVYPDADRIAQLSPWEQVGYAKEKLRMFNDTFPDKLAHAMQNSEKAINIQGINFTPKELHDNNVNGIQFKEAAVQVVAADIKKAAGLHKFSPELLELAGTNSAIQKSKEDSIAKYRSRYNIESSSNTRSKAEITWKTSAKSGEDIHHFLVKTAATVDGSNNIVGNSGAWKALESIIVTEGINNNDSGYAAEILNQPMPDRLAKQLGAKPGTTYAQHWPGKTATLQQQIKDGYTKKIDNDLKNLEAAGTGLEVKFIEEARQGDLTAAEVNQYKRQFGEMGLTIPSSVTNYETASDRSEREDKDLIVALMASQNGYISNEQLDAFHPKAALEYREKASRLEKAALQEFGSEKKIKAALDKTWESMGIKGNEKSLDYIEALENAKVDYADKYNKYVAMGYSPSQASHYALHAQEVVDPQTKEPLPDSKGILREIEEGGPGNKYVVIGQSIEKTAKKGDMRVVQIRMSKEQISQNPSIMTKEVIGGSYGLNQITKIQTNIEKYGPRGLYMDQDALAYYKGIARGRNPREGGWWGIVDAQLKANGYANGLGQSRPRAVDFQTGIDKDGKVIPNPRGSQKIDQSIARAFTNISDETVTHVNKMLIDSQRFGRGTSVWDNEKNWQSYLPSLIPGYVSPEEMQTYLQKKGDIPRDLKDILTLPDIMDGDTYARELPDDPIKRRKIEEARRRMENNPLGGLLK